MTQDMGNPGRCYCGHDCTRCVTYQATIRKDDALRRKAQVFYRNAFSIELSLSEILCLGGRSDQICTLCRDCPFIRCCREHAVEFCRDCLAYPCERISEYEQKYVNQCNQID